VKVVSEVRSCRRLLHVDHEHVVIMVTVAMNDAVP
jgi:hypothetical protein